MNYPWPKMMFVSNNFSKARAKIAHINLSGERDNIRSSGKRKTKLSENIEGAWEYEKQTFRKVKDSNPKHIREQNRKAQNNLREAIQSSNLNQTVE